VNIGVKMTHNGTRQELLALDLLESRGYKKDEIIRQNNGRPDFLCPDGKGESTFGGGFV
jgi:hypothetical protein